MNTVPPPVKVTTQRLAMPNMDLYYPIISGLISNQVQQTINSTILTLVYTLINEQHYYTNPGTQITGWYEIKTNERNVLSLNIGNYGYTPMAAHGMTYIKSLTFDTKTGKLFRLNELFKPNSDYVRILSDIIKAQIRDRNIQLLQDFTTIKPDQDYYIADKALVIYFQLYDITPYVFGFPMFPISVYSIQNIIREDSPLGKMATND